MNSYHISDLEKITGIKAHTIRIWEKRYNLIQPHRTATNIRFYDDDQALKLLNISTLLAKGFKISKISQLDNQQIHAQINDLQNDSTTDIKYIKIINDLIAAMLVFNEDDFDKSFSYAISSFGMYQAMINVFYPFLHKTGLMWNSDDVMPVQEHFANNIIRRKLISAIDIIPKATKTNKRFLLFLSNEEWHETALLFSDYIIKSKGYKTIYLGQNMPSENLDEIIKYTKPTHILTFFIARQEPKLIKDVIDQLAKKNKSVSILVSGSNIHDGNINKHNNTFILKEPNDLIKLL